MGFRAPVSVDTPFREVADALWAWSSSAAQALKNSGGHRELCDDFFVQSAQDVFEWRCRNRSIYDPGVRQSIYTLPSFGAIDAALRSDPVLAPLYGKFVGVGAEFVAIHPDWISGRAMPHDAAENAPRDLQFPDAAQIETMLRGLWRLLNERTITREFVTPLWNLHAEGSIDLEDGLTIEPLTDSDVMKALRMKVIVGSVASHRIYRRAPGANLALRRAVEIDVEIRDTFPTPEEAAGKVPEAFRRGYDDVDALLTLAPLTCTGTIVPGSTMTWTLPETLFGIQSVTYPPWAEPALSDRPEGRAAAKLTSQTGADLQRFWSAFRDSPNQGAIDLGLRRLRNARERRRDDERVLDLVIAAEALLLPPDEDHSELSFRTSLYGAYLLEDTVSARRRVYKWLQGAYRVRNKIAHGGAPKTVSIEGATYDLKSLAEEIDAIVRRVLERRLASDVDWRTLVFEEVR